MRVLVTGASGLVGKRLVRALLARGDQVVALSRRPDTHAWPSGVEAHAWDASEPVPAVRADAVVNLAGERVVGRRWTAAHRRALWDSRVLATRRVVDWIRAQPASPVLVSASAAGYYGADARGPCPESRGPGDGFLARLAMDWEAAAVASPGRVALLRFGHILDRDGGYLGTLLPYARWHLAGPLGGGQQPMSWVHVEDAVAAILWCLGGVAQGPYNVSSPGARGMVQATFAEAVAARLGKPLQFAVPTWMMKAVFGAGIGPAVTGGQDLRSDRLAQEGFTWAHPTLEGALRDLLPGYNH